MANRADITPELLRQLLRYEPETGKLFWKPRTVDLFKDMRCFNSWTARFSGKEALTARNTKGYYVGTILGNDYSAHRAAWTLYHGFWPVGDIDHINGNPSDNRASNLRDVSRTENCKNAKISTNNKSGVTGVSYWRRGNKWRVQIKSENKVIHIGYYKNFQDAVTARRQSEADYGFHSNHGRIGPLL